jgi:ABC-type methionine transport system permease subunit
VGRYSNEEKNVEAQYLEKALGIVVAKWETHSMSQIAGFITLETGYPASVKLVCSLRQRLDKRKIWGP